MAYTFASMPVPQSTTAEQIVNAITSIQDAVNDIDSRLLQIGDVAALTSRVAAVESSASSNTSGLSSLTVRVDALETASGTDGGSTISDRLLAALPPVLIRDLPSQQWRNAAGTLFADAEISALRPATILWVCEAGAEPTAGTNPFQANASYGDVVLVKAPAA